MNKRTCNRGQSKPSSIRSHVRQIGSVALGNQPLPMGNQPNDRATAGEQHRPDIGNIHHSHTLSTRSEGFPLFPHRTRPDERMRGTKPFSRAALRHGDEPADSGVNQPPRFNGGELVVNPNRWRSETNDVLRRQTPLEILGLALHDLGGLAQPKPAIGRSRAAHHYAAKMAPS